MFFSHDVFKKYSVAVLALSLVACSGGGSSTDNPSSKTPSGNEGNSPVSGPDVVDTVIEGALRKTTISLPNNFKNSAEHATLPHYLGTGKSTSGPAVQRLPIRTYYDSCAVDSDEPRFFVSLTLEDENAAPDDTTPTIGSVFEAKYDSVSGTLIPTSNATTLEMCNESHGISVSADCSRVAVLCSTLDEHVSETFTGEFVDLIVSYEAAGSFTNSPDNHDIIDSIEGLTQEQRESKYRQNGEIWLMEWENKMLSEDPLRFVIHKSVGGQQLATIDLVQNEADNSYAASFTSSIFDNDSEFRHKSAALMVITRDDENPQAWQLNPDRRGFDWACANGHTMFMRPFVNPYSITSKAPNGEYGALCTADANGSSAFMAGDITVKMERAGTLSNGYGPHYLVAASNIGVMNGGAHMLIPVDETRSIGILTAAEMNPVGRDDEFDAYIQFYEDKFNATTGLEGLEACNHQFRGECLYTYMYDDWSGGPGEYPLFKWGFWDQPTLEPHVLSKIGIFYATKDGESLPLENDVNQVKWIAEDDDCMLGSPQLVDLKNGRYLVGYGKYQCISDGLQLKRVANGTVNSMPAATMVPSAYYLMEIDVNGNIISAPTQVENTGWGGLDKFINMGEGKAAWAYIPSPELLSDGYYPEPEQLQWELVVYESEN